MNNSAATKSNIFERYDQQPPALAQTSDPADIQPTFVSQDGCQKTAHQKLPAFHPPQNVTNKQGVVRIARHQQPGVVSNIFKKSDLFVCNGNPAETNNLELSHTEKMTHPQRLVSGVATSLIR